MEKINNHTARITLVESSDHQATKVIQSIANIEQQSDCLIVVRIGCYLPKSALEDYAKSYSYNDFYVRSSITGLAKLLPIPKQNHILIFDIDLKNIYEFFEKLKDNYPIFEFLLIKCDKEKSNIKSKLLSSNNSLFYSIDMLKSMGFNLFFCGFDFDSQGFDSGVAKCYYADFIPEPLKLYFY